MSARALVVADDHVASKMARLAIRSLRFSRATNESAGGAPGTLR